MGCAIFFSFGTTIADFERTGQLPYLARILSAYAERFDRVVVFSYGREDRTYADRFRANVEFLPVPRGPLGWKYSYAALGAFLHHGRLRGCHVADLFSVGGIPPAWVTRRLARIPLLVRYNYPWAEHWIGSGEGWWPIRLRRWIGCRLERASFLCGDRIVVTTSALKGAVEDRVPGLEHRVEVLPHPADLARLPVKEEYVSNGVLRGIFVGRLAPQKNLPLLFDALERLHARSIPVSVRILGDGPERERLESDARARDLPVTFEGAVPADRVGAALAESDWFVLPSRTEGFPKSLMEGLAVGLPVVVTDVPGNRDLVRHERTGLVVAEDPSALADGVARFAGSIALREQLGRAAAEEARTLYGWDAVMQRRLDMLDRLARAGGETA